MSGRKAIVPDTLVFVSDILIVVTVFLIAIRGHSEETFRVYGQRYGAIAIVDFNVTVFQLAKIGFHFLVNIAFFDPHILDFLVVGMLRRTDNQSASGLATVKTT